MPKVVDDTRSLPITDHTIFRFQFGRLRNQQHLADLLHPSSHNQQGDSIPSVVQSHQGRKQFQFVHQNVPSPHPASSIRETRR